MQKTITDNKLINSGIFLKATLDQLSYKTTNMTNDSSSQVSAALVASKA